MPRPTKHSPKPKDESTIIRLVGVPLDSKTLTDSGSNSAVWVQVSRAGEYKGYGNSPFNLTNETFAQMIANFRNHPSYAAGVDGIGASDVVPWDFEHLSDPSCFDENTAVHGAPAQGWIQELDIRHGQDGVAELWALTRWLDTARSYIKSEQYKWASIDFAFDCVDPITGKDVGAVLFSVALTNNPFIEGMHPLAASRRGARVSLSNAESALHGIKNTLGLDELDDLNALMVEIAKIKQWVTSGGVPMGIDLRRIFADLRWDLNLPALSTELEVLAETEKLVTRLLEEQAIQSGQPSQAGPASNAIVAEGEEEMPELMKALAAQFGVRETEAEVQAAAKDSASLRVGLRNTLGEEKDTTKVLLDSVKGIVAERDKTNERLTALTKALGAKDGEDPTARITNLLKAETELGEIKPKHDKLAEQAAKAEAEKMETDVDRAISQHKLPLSVKDALVLLRKESPEKFAETYPLAEERHEHLTLQIASGTTTAPEHVAAPPSNVVDLSSYSGRNETARMVNYLLSNNPNAAKWSNDVLYQEAHKELQNIRLARAGR